MGRKKRKAADIAEEVPPQLQAGAAPSDPPTKPATTASVNEPQLVKTETTVDDIGGESAEAEASKNLKSGYAMTTHSAEILDEDIYVSDGSDDDDDDEKIALRDVEMVLAGSRMGVMRRGIHHPMLVQPNRQWVKETQSAKTVNDEDAVEDDEAEKKRKQQEEEELAKLDPAQRAARLLAEKQRKLEEAKVTARRVESEENAGRDPCLFSKRTAFDIRFDQIDDKPWLRGDLTDYFNYGLTEEDWLEYAQQQLMIRQELTDATRQRRAPDPTLVPVTPRAPATQLPKVAVAATGDEEGGDDKNSAENTTISNVPLGPMPVKKEDGADAEGKEETEEKKKAADVSVGLGGAWGAGAAPGSMLAKLIEEQGGNEESKPSYSEEDSKYGPGGGGGHYGGPPGGHHGGQDWNNQYGGGGGGGPYGRGQQQWDQYGGGRGGGRGGRGYYGGGGRGRGGRGGFRDQPYQGRGGGYHQDGGDPRKRPRDDYGGSRGGWRR